MTRPLVLILVAALAFAALAAAFYAAGAALMLATGAVVVIAVLGAFVWLTVRSRRRGSAARAQAPSP